MFLNEALKGLIAFILDGVKLFIIIIFIIIIRIFAGPISMIHGKWDNIQTYEYRQNSNTYLQESHHQYKIVYI